jgi:hypothetical protein
VKLVTEESISGGLLLEEVSSGAPPYCRLPFRKTCVLCMTVATYIILAAQKLTFLLSLPGYTKAECEGFASKSASRTSALFGLVEWYSGGWLVHVHLLLLLWSRPDRQALR